MSKRNTVNNLCCLLLAAIAVVNGESDGAYVVRTSLKDFDALLDIDPALIEVWDHHQMNASHMEATVYSSNDVLDKTIESFSLVKHLNMTNMAAIEQQESLFCRKKHPASSFWTSNKSAKDSSFFNCFRPYEEIQLFLKTLQRNARTAHRGFSITSEVASKTVEGRDIIAYRFSTNSTTKPKPVIYIQTLLHAREWLAPPTTIFAIAAFADGMMTTEASSESNAILQVLTTFDMIFVPVVNVDGYLHTWSSSLNRLWRKNRGGGSTGVDLNRNYGPTEYFCKSGASKNPSSETYCGEFAFSEPEVAGLNTYVQNLQHIAGGLDIHTYGSLVLRPLGRSLDDTSVPPEFTTIGNNVQSAINSAHAGSEFKSMKGSELYVHSGTFLDYLYLLRNVPTLCLELRGSFFITPASNIRLSGKEAMTGILAFAQSIKE